MLALIYGKRGGGLGGDCRRPGAALRLAFGGPGWAAADPGGSVPSATVISLLTHVLSLRALAVLLLRWRRTAQGLVARGLVA